MTIDSAMVKSVRRRYERGKVVERAVVSDLRGLLTIQSVEGEGEMRLLKGRDREQAKRNEGWRRG